MHVQVYTHRNVFYFNLNKEQLKGKNDDNRRKWKHNVLKQIKKKKRRISGMNYLGSNTKSTCWNITKPLYKQLQIKMYL